MKRVSTPGRAPAKEAGLPTRITSRCPRSRCTRSTAISPSGRCSGSTTAPPISPFRLRAKRPIASTPSCDYYGIANAKLVALAPGTVWETKQWRHEGFAAVARHFLQEGLAVTLIGTPRERALCDEVAALAPGAINLAGETTLPELAALIRRSAIAVTNDFGPMASCGRARPPGREHFRPDLSGLGWTLPPCRCRPASRHPLLAVLSAPAQPLHVRPRLHARGDGRSGHRAGRRRFAQCRRRRSRRLAQPFVHAGMAAARRRYSGQSVRLPLGKPSVICAA